MGMHGTGIDEGKMSFWRQGWQHCAMEEGSVDCRGEQRIGCCGVWCLGIDQGRE